MIQTMGFFILVLVTCILIILLVINGIRLLVQKTLKKNVSAKRIVSIKKNSIMIVISAVLAVVIMIYSQISTNTPTIDKNNENSIASLEKVTINGRNEWISIRGLNKDKPIILFLAGGPGGTQMAAARKNLASLEKEYVVVNWDQPGSGKSYGAAIQDKINVDTYIKDGIALTEYLCQRFNQDKIYLIGESWGSALAVFLAAEKPENYAGIIGTGQMVAFEETEILDYHKALEIAQERNDTSTIEKLKKNGAPPYYDGVTWKSADYLNYLSAYMASDPEITNSGFSTMSDLMAPEYGIIDKINFFRGLVNTFGKVYPQLYDVDLREDYAVLDVPVYFFIGRHDINAPTHLVEDYFDKLSAPRKQLVWFETSGHNPWINESNKFVEQVKEYFR